MANRLQLRKGTTAQNTSFKGAVGELTYDTQLDRLMIHNGVTVGGKVIVGTRIVTTPIDVNLENTTGVRIINGLGNTNLPLNVYGALNVYSNENFAIGALRVYQTFQPDISNNLFFRKWDGTSWSAWDRSVKFSEKNTEAFGVGQTWRDLTSSRWFNTTYVNPTSRPIFITVQNRPQYAAEGAYMTIEVNGLVVAGMSGNTGFFTTSSMSAVVPSGSFYKIGGTNIGIQRVVEYS